MLRFDDVNRFHNRVQAGVDDDFIIDSLSNVWSTISSRAIDLYRHRITSVEQLSCLSCMPPVNDSLLCATLRFIHTGCGALRCRVTVGRVTLGGLRGKRVSSYASGQTEKHVNHSVHL